MPNFPPPPDFMPAGQVERVELLLQAPDLGVDVATTRAKQDGMRFERKGQNEFLRRFEGQYVRGPWLRFMNSSRNLRLCQPDGWIIDLRKGIITIVEFKLSHTARAWWQVRRLYEPVTRALFNSMPWQYRVLEVVRWFDPAVAFPEETVMCSDPARVPKGKFGVHILR